MDDSSILLYEMNECFSRKWGHSVNTDDKKKQDTEEESGRQLHDVAKKKTFLASHKVDDNIKTKNTCLGQLTQLYTIMNVAFYLIPFKTSRFY